MKLLNLVSRRRSGIVVFNNNKEDVEIVKTPRKKQNYSILGPYCEKAVDVPDSFIARIKTPPRYPSPRPLSQTPDQLHYEKETRISEQDDFFHLSLRNSRKLQALAKNRPVFLDSNESDGIDNGAFVIDEDEQKIEPENEPKNGCKEEHGNENADEPAESVSGQDELMNALKQLQDQLNNNGLAPLAESATNVQDLLSCAAVGHALQTRRAVLKQRKAGKPTRNDAKELARECVQLLADSNSPDAFEFCNLQSSCSMEALLDAHDSIATEVDRMPAKDSTVFAPNDTFELMIHQNIANDNIFNQQIKVDQSPVDRLEENQKNIKNTILSQDPIIIEFEKSSEPLGVTIRNDGDAVIIGRIVRGGAAEKSQLLHEGDEILAVNGISLCGKSVNDVYDLLGTMTGIMAFSIMPAKRSKCDIVDGNTAQDPNVIHIRAHFDYDPENDEYIPCRELGLSFQKGDILHVISQDDPNWWQAYREGEEEHALAGLIPSQAFQHQRESLKQTALIRNKECDDGGKRSTVASAQKSVKKKPKQSNSEAGYPAYTATDDTDPADILTYEEVALYYPRASHKRPVVLIGPPNNGRHDIRQRLMADSDRFAAAVPHTSRAQRNAEVPGKDYHFVSRKQFDADILARRFVEHGEYEKAYYGTSLEAIRTVVASGKICVLNLHPQSMEMLRASELKPYVVMIAPPCLEKLRQQRERSRKTYKDRELKDIISSARNMEIKWGHLCDMIIVNNDVERACQQLLDEISLLERQPQWVPVGWVHSDK